MHQNSAYFTARVAVFPLLVAAGILVAPGSASGDRSTARSATPAEVSPEVVTPHAMTPAAESASAFDASAWETTAIGAIDRSVYSHALESAASAVARGDAEPATLTVIDFSRPSTTRRMWIYDLRSRELLFEEHVAHGRNSGHDRPTMFSNEPESNKSSLGLFRAAEGYVGKHGYSLRLDGLEPGINDRARARAIVIHGAAYVNEKTARAQGRLGRSLGCPAVRPEISRRLIDAIKDGGLVFAYYPDPDWLQSSAYLN
jgi:hypothetical protein